MSMYLTKRNTDGKNKPYINHLYVRSKESEKLWLGQGYANLGSKGHVD